LFGNGGGCFFEFDPVEKKKKRPMTLNSAFIGW
jgi:hypothetical protein